MTSFGARMAERPGWRNLVNYCPTCDQSRCNRLVALCSLKGLRHVGVVRILRVWHISRLIRCHRRRWGPSTRRKIKIFKIFKNYYLEVTGALIASFNTTSVSLSLVNSSSLIDFRMEHGGLCISSDVASKSQRFLPLLGRFMPFFCIYSAHSSLCASHLRRTSTYICQQVSSARIQISFLHVLTAFFLSHSSLPVLKWDLIVYDLIDTFRFSRQLYCYASWLLAVRRDQTTANWNWVA